MRRRADAKVQMKADDALALEMELKETDLRIAKEEARKEAYRDKFRQFDKKYEAKDQWYK